MIERIASEQRAFSDAITIGTDASFDVYRNNLVYGFVNSQWQIFQCVIAGIGDDNFRYFMKEYGTTLGMSFSDLAEVGSGFSAFLAAHPKLIEAQWIADIAALEYACYQSMRRPSAIASPMFCEGLVTVSLRHDVLPVYRQLKNSEPISEDKEMGHGEYFYALYVEDEQVEICPINHLQSQLIELVKNGGGMDEMIIATGEAKEEVLQGLQQLLSAGLLKIED